MSIDYGIKRCGIAVTDPLQLIVNGLDTVDTPKLLDFLKIYMKENPVEKLVIGHPTHKDGKDTYLMEYIISFQKKIEQLFPEMNIAFFSENFTSKKASQYILQSGAKLKTRQDKKLLDKMSAVVILQDYLGHY